MRLQAFNEKDYAEYLKPPTITLSKVGVVLFSKSAIRLIKATAGDRVEFFEDNDRPGNWYLQVLPEDAKNGHVLGFTRNTVSISRRRLCNALKGAENALKNKRIKLKINKTPKLYNEQYYYQLEQVADDPTEKL